MANVASHLPARLSAARAILLLFTLVIFTLESYVTQTHVHFDPSRPDVYENVAASAAAFVKSGISDQSAQAKHERKLPEGPDNCPICQQILHNGSFVTPSAIASLPPALAVSIVAVVIDSAIALRPVSHNWRGRAPPRH
jgi:hypothetical protein